LEGKEIGKKTLSKKVDGSPWIHPQYTCFLVLSQNKRELFQIFPIEILEIESATNAENVVNIIVLFVVRVIELLWGDQGEKWTFSSHDVSQKIELAG